MDLDNAIQKMIQQTSEWWTKKDVMDSLAITTHYGVHFSSTSYRFDQKQQVIKQLKH